MGSTLSVVNETKCPLNICLKQATVLYHENNVRPGETFRRDVGKVWFTLEARLWNGENGYDVWRDLAMPAITLLSVGALLPIGAGARALGSTLALTASVAKGAAATIVSWVSDHVVRDHGIYMGSNRTIRIRGGPASPEWKDWRLHISSAEPFYLHYD